MKALITLGQECADKQVQIYLPSKYVYGGNLCSAIRLDKITEDGYDVAIYVLDLKNASCVILPIKETDGDPYYEVIDGPTTPDIIGFQNELLKA